MSDPAFNGFGEQDDGFGVTLSWSFGILFVSSLVGTYLILKVFDRFLRTEISEEHLARLIARLEQGEDQRTRRQTMFVNMTEEERRNVLEKVLLRKPYTNDILDGIVSERENKALLESEEGKEVASNNAENEGNLDSDNKNNDDRDGDGDGDGKGKNNDNILQKVNFPWLDFTSQQPKNDNEKNSIRSEEESEEDQCLICMDSYEIGTDVTVGHTCIHMYHTRCILKWMCAKHDFCPICRKYLFDVKEFRDTAKDELGTDRFEKLVQEDHPDLVAMYMDTGTNTGDEELINRESENNQDDDEISASRDD